MRPSRDRRKPLKSRLSRTSGDSALVATSSLSSPRSHRSRARGRQVDELAVGAPGRGRRSAARFPRPSLRARSRDRARRSRRRRRTSPSCSSGGSSTHRARTDRSQTSLSRPLLSAASRRRRRVRFLVGLRPGGGGVRLRGFASSHTLHEDFALLDVGERRLSSDQRSVRPFRSFASAIVRTSPLAARAAARCWCRRWCRSRSCR